MTIQHTPNFNLPYPQLTDTSDVPRDISALANALEAIPSLRSTLETSLPPTPFDGQEIYYVANSANGVIWHLRYREAAAGTYKWEFVGGSNLTNEINSLESPVSGGTWTDLPTVGPQVTAPLAGDYEIAFSARLGTTSGGWAGVAPKIGAAATNDNDQAQLLGAGFTAGTEITVPAARIIRRNVPTASSVIKLQYYNGGGTTDFRYRTLTVRPIRVG